MITRSLTDIGAPAGAAPSNLDPRTAAMLAAAKLGIRLPVSGGASIQAPSPAQAMTLDSRQSLPQPGATGVAPGALPTGPVGSNVSVNQQGGPTEFAQGSASAAQVSPQRQAMIDALRSRMGGIGMGGQIGERMAELTPTQKAALAARNMVADRGVFAGQQTGAAMPPFRGQQ